MFVMYEVRHKSCVLSVFQVNLRCDEIQYEGEAGETCL
jgi:hypothetical protein